MKACFLFFLVLTVIPSLAQEQSEFAKYKQAVIRANDLAGRIHSRADAKEFVSAIGFLFPKELDPEWANRGILSQLASVEYESANDGAKLIPEQRLADVWNQYVREISAPNEAIVTPAEIHNIRDLDLTGAQSTWTADRATRWTLPNIYATGSDGRVAAGCRAVEALRVVYDLNSYFPLISARERMSKGIVPSEEARKPKTDGTARILVHGGPENPMDIARKDYIKKHGSQAYDQLLTRLFNQLFPRG